MNDMYRGIRNQTTATGPKATAAGTEATAAGTEATTTTDTKALSKSSSDGTRLGGQSS